MSLTTLCYIEKDGCYLMLHRIVKKNDINKDKWIGVGGHFEEEESPEECLLREVKEETGLVLTSYQYRGIVTFVSGNGVTEYMSLYTADGFEGEMIPCNEGVLEWVPKEKVFDLNIWEGDKIFFRLIQEDRPFFSLKLVYDGGDTLIQAVLDGKDILEREVHKMAAIALTNETFQKEVLEAKETVLVDFWAPWCGPCQAVLPIVEELSETMTDAKICKVNVDEQKELTRQYKVMSIPTLMVFKDGQMVKRSMGAKSKEEIEDMIKNI